MDLLNKVNLKSRIFSALIFSLLLSPLVIAESKTTNELQSGCQLKFGWADWAPLQYYDASGNLTGVQVDLVNAVSKEVGCEVEYIQLSWAEIVEGIKSGDIDFTANATENDSRKEFAYFSIPYRRDTFSFWVKKDNYERYNIGPVEKLMKSGMKLGLISNQLYSPEIENWQNDPIYGKNIVYSDGIDQLISLLIDDKVEVVVEDAYIMAYRKRAGIFSKKIARLSIETFGFKVAFMFSIKTTSKKVVDKYNNKLRELKNTELFQSIWLNPELIQ